MRVLLLDVVELYLSLKIKNLISVNEDAGLRNVAVSLLRRVRRCTLWRCLTRGTADRCGSAGGGRRLWRGAGCVLRHAVTDAVLREVLLAAETHPHRRV